MLCTVLNRRLSEQSDRPRLVRVPGRVLRPGWLGIQIALTEMRANGRYHIIMSHDVVERRKPVINVMVEPWVADALDDWRAAHGGCSRASVVRMILEPWAKVQVVSTHPRTTEAA